MANSRSISMGVPPHSSPNHLTTSSSAIANYSIALTQQPVRLCFRTTVVHQGLMGITDLVERLLWNRTCHFTVKRQCRNGSFVPFDPENVWIGPPENCVESV